jgi:hypothetical protein
MKLYGIMQHSIFLIGIITTMSVMSIVPVNAYETFGGSWSDTNVRDLDWKVKSGIDYYYDIGDAASGATASWQDCVESDCPDFNQVSSGYEVYILDYYDDYGYLMFTVNDPDWTSTYTYSRIFVNEYWLDESYYENPQHMQGVMAHELGHTLGLAHEDDYGAIVLMYPTDLFWWDCGIYQPEYDDISGVVSIYG